MRQLQASGGQLAKAGPAGGVARARAAAPWLTAPRFTVVTLLICLVLQRFAIPAGGALKISVATPLVLSLAAWGLACGTLVIDRVRAGLFLALCGVALVATAVQINVPLAIAPRTSMTSLIYWLAITAVAVLRFATPMPEKQFFRLVGLCLSAIAAAGLLQFAAQFAGLHLFSFEGLVPGNLLIEEQYNEVIPLAGETLKSNGFFLVEPSVFSQFMALGVILESAWFRRPGFMLLYFAGLLASASGTGWLVLGAYVLWIALTSGPRGILAAVLVTGGAAGFLTAASFVVPDVTESLFGRLGEFSLPGSSGYERFVTPFLAWRAVLHAAPWSFFTGVGPGASEQLTVPFFYTLNTPVKIIAEYGVFGLLLYVSLLLAGRRPPQQGALMAPLLVLLLFTGGYHQFSPILFPVLLLGTVARLVPG